MFHSVGTIVYTVIDIDAAIRKHTLVILQQIDDILALRNPGKPLP
jgi:hypothetical protein